MTMIIILIIITINTIMHNQLSIVIITTNVTIINADIIIINSKVVAKLFFILTVIAINTIEVIISQKIRSTRTFSNKKGGHA
jgi:hypothetical protein